MTTLPAATGNIAGAVAADFFSVLLPGVPGASTAGEITTGVINGFLGRRLEKAREILIEEVRLGHRSLVEAGHEDEALSIIERYLRAAREGAARLNLRLMARIVAGQAERGNLVADEFLYYADLLASLRQEEVIVLATLYRYWTSTDVQAMPDDERKNATNQRTRDELVPAALSSKELLLATLGAVSRTGLVISASAWGGIVYFPSPLMDDLNRLCPLGEVLCREGAG
ncbi:MAG: hypothetical protein HZC25_08045 [Rhodospirillales bacterium]|nr:hypothetical protein [Rhodospirillales bacterium]